MTVSHPQPIPAPREDRTVPCRPDPFRGCPSQRIDHDPIVAIEPRRLRQTSVGAYARSNDNEVNLYDRAICQHGSGNPSFMPGQAIQPHAFAEVDTMACMKITKEIGRLGRRHPSKDPLGHFNKRDAETQFRGHGCCF